MPKVGLGDYVSDKDKFCMYKVMVGEKVNLPKVIFFYWLHAFKVRFQAKNKKNHIPYGIFFTQIMRNIGVDVSVMELSTRTTQLKGLKFVKMGIVDNFP